MSETKAQRTPGHWCAEAEETRQALNTLHERCARFERMLAQRMNEHDALSMALASLSGTVEERVRHGLRWEPDYACGDCVPGDSSVIAGFRCGRHRALATLAAVRGETP